MWRGDPFDSKCGRNRRLHDLCERRRPISVGDDRPDVDIDVQPDARRLQRVEVPIVREVVVREVDLDEPVLFECLVQSVTLDGEEVEVAERPCATRVQAGDLCAFREQERPVDQVADPPEQGNRGQRRDSRHLLLPLEFGRNGLPELFEPVRSERSEPMRHDAIDLGTSEEPVDGAPRR